MLTVIVFLLVLSVLVVAHEWGHYIVAKKSGMKVYEFGLGFPPRALGAYKDPKTKKWKIVIGKGKSDLADAVDGNPSEEEYPTTLYSLNWLPLGGFVKIKGENGEARKEKDSFGYQPYYKKAAVLVAGVTMNVILAGVLLGIGFIGGIPSDVSDNALPAGATIAKGPWVMIEQVQEGSPAQEAGVKYGDIIVSYDGITAKSYDAAMEYLKNTQSTSVVLALEREGKIDTYQIPVKGKPGEQERVGILIRDIGFVSYPWYLAIVKGFGAAIALLGGIFFGLWMLLKTLIVGGGAPIAVSGPVGIASIVGQSAKMGLPYLIHVSAMISLSLAAMNILPIPALDGGRLVFVTLERIMKKPLPLKYEQTAHTIGFLLLMALILFVTYRDILTLL